MIHTPTAISIFVCLSMVQLMAVFISMRCTLCGHFLQVALTLILVVGYAIANLHTDQERDYFMQRYHDVISSFGGKTSYDADNRPLLVMRSNLWASGYDVDGTDQTSLGQFSGRVQQTYKHSVPRFFVP